MDRRRAFLRAPVSDGACLSNDSRGACHWGAFSRRTLHMRVGPSRLVVIDVARQSGQDGASPHRRMSPRRRALPNHACSRCLSGPAAQPQLLFLFHKANAY